MIARQLTEFGVTSLEKLVNAAVAYDTETAQLLDELNDITIALNINPPESFSYTQLTLPTNREV